MLVQDAAIVVARAIKRDGVCNFGTGALTIRKCRHCGASWKKSATPSHDPACPVVAADMILQNNEAYPSLNGYQGIGTEEISRMLILCVEKLGGNVEFDPMQLDSGTGRGLGMSLSKNGKGLAICVIDSMGEAE